MKKHLIYLVFAILLCLQHEVVAQDITKTEIIDEWNRITCEDERGRFDNLFQEILSKPGTTGYAIFYPEQGDFISHIYLLSAISHYGALRKIPANRLAALLGPAREEFKNQLFLAPTEAERPDFPLLNWKIGRGFKKPLKFHALGYSENCAYNGERVFFTILEHNPLLRGNIVIKKASLKSYNASKNEILNGQSSIVRKRLRFFYVKSDLEDIELWLLPLKKS